ncbi:NUDIX domain-containing protein [Thioclava sp. BHET1]|nr:NUDIX domain-containing protein [Thioclava sp. BHET1]
MIQHFFYGTLCHPPLLAAVIGRVPEMRRASLTGFAAREACAEGGGLGFPILVPEAGITTRGLLCQLSDKEAEAISWYEWGYRAEQMDVVGPKGLEPARVWHPESGHWEVGDLWTLDDWMPRWGALKTEGAREFIREARQIGPEAANRRYGSILLRAASKINAQTAPLPETLRRKATPDDVKIEAQDIGYHGFFLVEDYRLRHRLFDGGQSEPLERAVFVSGDAAVVLPYDPARDRVLLIEQFRPGPMARGEPNPWLIEAIAGRVDPGEPPETTARREALEEAGITLAELIKAPRFYASPGAKTEFIHCYIGVTDLPDEAGSPGGLASEGEDIRPHLVPFSRLMEMVESGEAGNAPLVVLALWLAQNRAQLRAKA